MSVQLNPSKELGFNRPLTQVARRTLTVTNHNAQPIVFKVKTTAPKRYCVRPNSGTVEPGGSIDVQGGRFRICVQILMQAMREDPPSSHECKDKFLVQSMVLTPDLQSKPGHDIWKFDEEEEAPLIHRQKIKVLYLPPEGRSAEKDHIGEANPRARHVTHEDLLRRLGSLPEVVRSPLSQHMSATREALIPALIAPPQPSPTPSPPPQQESNIWRPQSPGKDRTIVEEVVTYSQTVGPPSGEQPNIVNINIVAPSNPPTPGPGPILALAREPSEEVAFAELNQRYTEAQVEIDQLQGLLASIPSEGRRDKGMSDGGDAVVGDVGKGWTIVELDPTTVQQSEGVPLQMVMPIALVSPVSCPLQLGAELIWRRGLQGVFATTYLFF
ncbi:phosphatidylinositol-binding protein scs2 [Ceratobasidium sp. 414]|nr:phosphatidylinositol-binding protein scs2 [Ceratobasidium sp. 414]